MHARARPAPLTLVRAAPLLPSAAPARLPCPGRHGGRCERRRDLHDRRGAVAARLRPVPGAPARVPGHRLGRGGHGGHAAVLRGAVREGGVACLRWGRGPHQQRRLHRDAPRGLRRRPRLRQIRQTVCSSVLQTSVHQ